MRISPEGTLAAWPGDNPNQCSQGYNCPPPTLALDSNVPQGSRFVDVGAGGPNPFTFTVSSNVTWLIFSPSKGSVSPNNPETRVEIRVDWSKVTGTQYAQINFNATAQGQPMQSTPAYFVATKNTPAAGFKGWHVNGLPKLLITYRCHSRLRRGRWGCFDRSCACFTQYVSQRHNLD